MFVTGKLRELRWAGKGAAPPRYNYLVRSPSRSGSGQGNRSGTGADDGGNAFKRELSCEANDALAPTAPYSEAIMNTSGAFPIVDVGASAGGLEPS